MQRKWIFPQSAQEENNSSLVQALSLLQPLALPKFLSSLLIQRGFSQPDSVEKFLYPRLQSLSPQSSYQK